MDKLKFGMFGLNYDTEAGRGGREPGMRRKASEPPCQVL